MTLFLKSGLYRGVEGWRRNGGFCPLEGLRACRGPKLISAERDGYCTSIGVFGRY